MISYISYTISYIIYDIIPYIIYDICSFAGADNPKAPLIDAIDDGKRNPGRDMDFDEERDFADQGPLNDMDMEEDSQIIATHSLLRELS